MSSLGPSQWHSESVPLDARAFRPHGHAQDQCWRCEEVHQRAQAVLGGHAILRVRLMREVRSQAARPPEADHTGASEGSRSSMHPHRRKATSTYPKFQVSEFSVLIFNASRTRKTQPEMFRFRPNVTLRGGLRDLFRGRPAVEAPQGDIRDGSPAGFAGARPRRR